MPDEGSIADETAPTREALLFQLYEAAELEHTLMCTYLYAAFSLKDEGDGLRPEEAQAVARWRRQIFDVGIDEMGHLTAVWNITAALGGAPSLGRGNFPLDPGHLPADVVIKLARFSPAMLQHFIHLERPVGSDEPEGEGFQPIYAYHRGVVGPRLTPMARDYHTIGEFYAQLEGALRAFAEDLGDDAAFIGDPGLQLSPAEVDLTGARTVLCLKTALEALDIIIEEGEGAPAHSENSHYSKFIAIREEYAALKAANPDFEPAHPAAENPVLRPPILPHGRVWIEDETAAETVDLANSAYALMLRLIAYAYAVRGPSPEKSLALDLAIGLMPALTPLAEAATRLPAGPSHPGINAGVTFAALRDAAALPQGAASRRFFVERLRQLATTAGGLAGALPESRVLRAQRLLEALAQRAASAFANLSDIPASPQPVERVASAPPPAPVPAHEATGVDAIEAQDLNLIYEGKRCIHARFCVTGAPKVFLANVEGPWIHPDAMPVDALVEIAHACPSGAIRYRRKDGKPDETAPPVNLVAVREGGPYAVRGDIRLDGQPAGFRATLCRCGASKNKPYCDGSHHDVEFSASGEPPTTAPDMLAVRDGPLEIAPQPDGPLHVRGNLEITSGTGRVVARVQTARLCRCGASATKPFCDNSHLRVGFRS